MKCPICQTREPHHPLVCDADRAWLPTVLREIVEGYALLAVVEVIPATLDPEPGWSDPVAETLPAGTVWSGSRGAPVTGSREAPVPVPLDVVDLLGPARIPNPMRGPGWYPLSLWPEDQIGYLPVATELELWVIDWIGHRGQAEHRPEPTVASLAGWLADRIPDACDDHPAIDEFATDLRRIRASIRRANGDIPVLPEPIIAVPCSGCDTMALFRPPHDAYRAECGQCGKLYTDDEYARWTGLLAAQMKGRAA